MYLYISNMYYTKLKTVQLNKLEQNSNVYMVD